MTALRKRKTYTPEEYLALEEKAEYRSEYVNGYIFKLAGATEAHQDITLNIAAQFKNLLRGRCKAYASEMKVWVEEAKTYFYPDVTVVCGEREFHNGNTGIVENPILLVEVLSRSTEDYDKNDKFFTYQNIESFQEYVLISQHKPIVQRYVKQKDGNWVIKATIGLDSTVYFESVETEIALADIYDLVEFESNDGISEEK